MQLKVRAFAICLSAGLFVATSVGSAGASPKIGEVGGTDNDAPEVEIVDDVRIPGFRGVVDSEKASQGDDNGSIWDDIIYEPTARNELGLPLSCTPAVGADGKVRLDPICTESVATPGIELISPRQQAQDFVRSYLRRVKLQKPTPKMSSTTGVCGATHYLDLQMSAERIFTDSSAPQGPLTLHAYATTTIDWGDGKKQVVHSGGAAGTKSDISHYWTDRGSYVISATTTWMVRWSMGGFTGTLSTSPVTVRTDPWQVYSLDAVITQG